MNKRITHNYYLEETNLLRAEQSRGCPKRNRSQKNRTGLHHQPFAPINVIQANGGMRSDRGETKA